MAPTPPSDAPSSKHRRATQILARATIASSLFGLVFGIPAFQQQAGAPQQAVVVCAMIAAAVVPYVILRAVVHLE